MASLLAAAAQPALRWRAAAAALRSGSSMLGPRTAAVAAVARRHGHLHETAGKGPQPETLFRPDVASLAGGGEGEQEESLPQELPGFASTIGPAREYGEGERPQPQTAPEPDNPLPQELPPNHPDEAPKGPEPEVVPPRREDPGPAGPPDMVPTAFPIEAPPLSAPAEFPAPGTTAPPEFSPGVPSEMPDRGGGSEVQFPS